MVNGFNVIGIPLSEFNVLQSDMQETPSCEGIVFSLLVRAVFSHGNNVVVILYVVQFR
jgi:hypothetical protein